MGTKDLVLIDFEHDVKNCLINTAAGACRLGYNLIQIRDRKLYEDSLYYKNFCPEEYLTGTGILKFTKYGFYEYCKDAFNLSRRSVDRFISICCEFCVKSEISAVTNVLDKKYVSYSVSALSEMLYLSEKQREKCDSSMDIKSIRSIKNQSEPDDCRMSSPDAGAPSTPTSSNWNNVIEPEDVDYHDDVPLMKSRTYKKKKYMLSSEEYDCFVDSVSGFSSSFSKVSSYLNKGYLVRLVLYKPEE